MEHHAATIKNKERFFIMLWSDHQDIPTNGNKTKWKKKGYIYTVYPIREFRVSREYTHIYLL